MGPAGVNTGPHERRAQAGPGSRRANLLVIDAFSSDAVPVHLLTREAPANVCGIHEYGEHGIFGYIAMDLVEGKDLRQVLRGSGELAWDEAFDVWQEVGPGHQKAPRHGAEQRTQPDRGQTVGGQEAPRGAPLFFEKRARLRLDSR